MHPTANEFIYQLKFQKIITLDSNLFYFFVRLSSGLGKGLFHLIQETHAQVYTN